MANDGELAVSDPGDEMFDHIYYPPNFGCRDCADSDGFCMNDKRGRNCGFPKGHNMHQREEFRPATASDYPLHGTISLGAKSKESGR